MTNPTSIVWLKISMDNLLELKADGKLTDLQYTTDSEGNGIFKYKYDKKDRITYFRGTNIVTKEEVKEYCESIDKVLATLKQAFGKEYKESDIKVKNNIIYIPIEYKDIKFDFYIYGKNGHIADTSKLVNLAKSIDNLKSSRFVLKDLKFGIDKEGTAKFTFKYDENSKETEIVFSGNEITEKDIEANVVGEYEKKYSIWVVLGLALLIVFTLGVFTVVLYNSNDNKKAKLKNKFDDELSPGSKEREFLDKVIALSAIPNNRIDTSLDESQIEENLRNMISPDVFIRETKGINQQEEQEKTTIERINNALNDSDIVGYLKTTKIRGEEKMLGENDTTYMSVKKEDIKRDGDNEWYITLTLPTLNELNCRCYLSADQTTKEMKTVIKQCLINMVRHVNHIYELEEDVNKNKMINENDALINIIDALNQRVFKYEMDYAQTQILSDRDGNLLVRGHMNKIRIQNGNQEGEPQTVTYYYGQNSN